MVDSFLILTAASLAQELIDVEGDGMADMVFRCIQEMDIDNRMMVISYVFVLVILMLYKKTSKKVQLDYTIILMHQYGILWNYTFVY